MVAGHVESRTKIAGLWVPILLVILAGRLRLRGSSPEPGGRGGDGGNRTAPTRRGDRHQRRSRAARRLPPAAGGRTLMRFFDAFNQGAGGTLPLVFHLGRDPSPPDFSSMGYRPWSLVLLHPDGEGGQGDAPLHHLGPGRAAPLLREASPARGDDARLLKVSLTQVGVLDRESTSALSTSSHVRPRTSARPRPARIAYGKGSLNCENLRIFTWSMNMKTRKTGPNGRRRLALQRPPDGGRRGRGGVYLGASGFPLPIGRRRDRRDRRRAPLILLPTRSGAGREFVPEVAFLQGFGVRGL
jgi:hypothetical protein